MAKWIETPAQTVVLNHGKGANVVTGPVRIAFTGATHAHVSTDGSDAGAVVVRGKKYNVSLHVVKHYPDSTWHEHPDNRAHNVSPRGVMDHWAAAAPTIRAAIVAAVLDEVTKAATGEVLRQAVYANASQNLDRLVPERAKLAAKLAELDAEIAAHELLRDSNAPLV